MKYFYWGMLSLACVWVSQAQTNVSTNGVEAILALVTTNQPARPEKKPPTGMSPVRGKIVIQATGPAVLDMKSHWMTYSDNVSVTNAQMKLTCEWLMADLPQDGEQITNIVAETNVVIDFTDEKGEKTHGIGDMAVYFYHVNPDGATNETITLTGDPEKPPTVEVGQNITMRATNFVYDCIAGKVSSHGQFFGVYNTNAPSGTNRPAGSKLF